MQILPDLLHAPIMRFVRKIIEILVKFSHQELVFLDLLIRYAK